MAGLSESLSKDGVEHNIRVLIVEPGVFRTRFLAAYKTTASTANLGHYSSAKAVLDRFAVMDGKQQGDPSKAAARIVEVVTGEGLAGHLKGKVLRMPLGPDCVGRYEGKIESMRRDLETVGEIARSTNVDE